MKLGSSYHSRKSPPSDLSPFHENPDCTTARTLSTPGRRNSAPSRRSIQDLIQAVDSAHVLLEYRTHWLSYYAHVVVAVRRDTYKKSWQVQLSGFDLQLLLPWKVIFNKTQWILPLPLPSYSFVFFFATFKSVCSSTGTTRLNATDQLAIGSQISGW